MPRADIEPSAAPKMSGNGKKLMTKSDYPYSGDLVRNDCPLSVLPEWTDYNDHFNVAYYTRAFDLAARHFQQSCDDTILSFVVRKSRVSYLREVHRGRKLTVTTQIIAINGNNLHLLQTMYAEGGESPVAIEERIEAPVWPESEGPKHAGHALPAGFHARAQAHHTIPVPDGWGSLNP